MPGLGPSARLNAHTSRNAGLGGVSATFRFGPESTVGSGHLGKGVSTQPVTHSALEDLAWLIVSNTVWPRAGPCSAGCLARLAQDHPPNGWWPCGHLVLRRGAPPHSQELGWMGRGDAGANHEHPISLGLSACTPPAQCGSPPTLPGPLVPGCSSPKFPHATVDDDN